MNAAAIERLIREGLPQAEQNDFRVDEVGAGYALARQPFLPELIRPGGTLSGPTIMALADGAMYAAVLAALGGEVMAVTQSLNFQFLAKPQPADLLARARIVKHGKRSIFLDVILFQKNESEPVAHASGCYAIPLNRSV